MNIITSMQTSSLPGFLFHQPPIANIFPHVVEVGDAWGKIGSGIGNERSSELTALGEYFERRHFYMEISVEHRARLNETLAPEEVSEFLKALLQTSTAPTTRSNIDDHVFGMSKVNRISDFSECSIPTAMLSLTSNKNDVDNRYYPQRDTCGCSFHLSSESSILGALKEGLERQFLTRFWLTKKCNFKIQSEALERLFATQHTSGLFNILTKAGTLRAFEISDPRFPGACVILVYGSDDTSRQVKYCAGMAYSDSLTSALNKSLLELWQTFRFMYLFGKLEKTSSDVDDPYLRHFLDSNRIETFEEISSTSSTFTANTLDIVTDEITVDTLLRSLNTLGISGYLYIRKRQFDGYYYTYSKFVSPSLFLHMNNSQNLNIHNTYSKEFGSAINTDRQSQMVPFP